MWSILTAVSKAANAFKNRKQDVSILKHHIAECEKKHAIGLTQVQRRAQEQFLRLQNDVASATWRGLYFAGGLTVTSLIPLTSSFIAIKLGLFSLPVTLVAGGFGTLFFAYQGFQWAKGKAHAYDATLEDGLIHRKIEKLVQHIDGLPDNHPEKALLQTFIYGQEGLNGQTYGHAGATTESIRAELTNYYRNYLNKKQPGYLQARSLIGSVIAFSAGIFVDITKGGLQGLRSLATNFATKGFKKGFIKQGKEMGGFYGDRLGFVAGLVGLPYLYSAMPALSALVTLPIWVNPTAWVISGLFGSFAGSKLGRELGQKAGKLTAKGAYHVANFALVKPYNALGFGGYPATAAYFYALSSASFSLPVWGIGLGAVASFYAGSWIGRKLYEPIESINHWLMARGLMKTKDIVVSATTRSPASAPVSAVVAEANRQEAQGEKQSQRSSWMPTLSWFRSRCSSAQLVDMASESDTQPPAPTIPSVIGASQKIAGNSA